MSEQEQAHLREIEARLAADDPAFARLMSSSGRAGHLPAGVLAALLGIAGLVAGTATGKPIVGIAGYVTALAGTVIAWQARARRDQAEQDRTPAGWH